MVSDTNSEIEKFLIIRIMAENSDTEFSAIIFFYNQFKDISVSGKCRNGVQYVYTSKYIGKVMDRR